MKKKEIMDIFIKLIVTVVLFFLVYFLFSFNENVEIKEIITKSEKIIGYDKYTKVKVYVANIDRIVEMNLEEYIMGVISAEMPAEYNLEALKAQSIASRTYTINKIINNGGLHEGADICTDSKHCQAYLSKDERIEKWNEKGQDGLALWNKIEEAVNSTKGSIIVYNWEPIKAFYHANSGGMTENVELVWGEKLQYLQAVETFGEEKYTQYSSSIIYTYAEVRKILKEKYPNVSKVNNKNIEIIEKSNSDRVQKMKIANIFLSGIDARKIFNLKSTNFTIELSENQITFRVIGYGHGVGMSQNGANELANSGYLCNQILQHYYIGVEIKKMY